MTSGESKQEPAPPSPPDVPDNRPFAWQPFTPRGVAAFAQATFGRLFIVELIVALLAAAAVVWFLQTAWFPTVRESLRQLPEQGVLRNQELSSPRNSIEPLAENRWLAFVVNLEGESGAAVRSDLLVEFRRNNFLVCSVFGCLVFNYPKNYTIDVNRPELEPWWGAWEPILMGITIVGVVFGLFTAWFLLATFYFVPVRLLAFFKDRELCLSGSWKLASAALLPGALLLTAGIVAYGFGALDLIHLLLVAVLHFVVGWVYLFSLFALPRAQAAGPRLVNPFVAAPAEIKSEIKSEPENKTEP